MCPFEGTSDNSRDMLNFVDLGEDVVKHHPPLLDWILPRTEQDGLKPLTPKGWYKEGHGITRS